MLVSLSPIQFGAPSVGVNENDNNQKAIVVKKSKKTLAKTITFPRIKHISPMTSESDSRMGSQLQVVFLAYVQILVSANKDIPPDKISNGLLVIQLSYCISLQT